MSMPDPFHSASHLIDTLAHAHSFGLEYEFIYSLLRALKVDDAMLTRAIVAALADWDISC